MEYELYHYGVKGMKWGIRKEDRYDSWKSRQHSRLDQQTSKDQAKWDRKISRTKKAIADKGNTAERKAQLATLNGKKKASAAMNKIGHKDIDSLTMKDYDDKVKLELGKTVAGLTSVALASAGVLPIGMLYMPSMDLNMRDYRVRK